MRLTKYKIGELISVIDEKNTESIREFYGININKEFMPTISKTEDLDEKKYKVVRKNRFVFSGMQTGRDKCIRISMYEKDTPVIVSPAYTVFEVSKKQSLLPEYLFMIFISKEKDRMGWFYSDSSVRANLDWDVFCDIEIDLPYIEIQKKYVNIYKEMVKNQKIYESSLGDLKLVCDGYIEKLRKDILSSSIGEYIEPVSKINSDSKVSLVKGVESSGNFINTRAKMQGVDISKYTVVSKGDIVYNPSRINLGSIALYQDDEPCIVSPMYQVFKSKDTDKLLPEYLMLWFKREEFKRYTWFYSSGSVRDTFDFKLMKEVLLPIPDITVQQAIIKIYKSYILRYDINIRLKQQLKDICPILIKGALQEAEL